MAAAVEVSNEAQALKFAPIGSTTIPAAGLSAKVREGAVDAHVFQLTFSQVLAFVQQAHAICKPAKVYVCTGTVEERHALMQTVIEAGTAKKLNSITRPDSYVIWTDPLDVARSEKDTYICSKIKKDAGPTNNWADPEKKRAELMKLFDGSMRGACVQSFFLHLSLTCTPS